MEAGKYYYSDPEFEAWLRGTCEERERRENDPNYRPERKPTPATETTYMDRKNASQPPSPKQIAFLKKLGAKSLPMSKLEASAMISELLANQG